MDGYVMWIVLGALIGLVALFIIVTTILDRRKRKKLKEIEKQTQAETEEAKLEIMYFASEIIKGNEKLLKDFVPSVGKLKMSDIRNCAKEAIKKLIISKEYRLIEDEEDSIRLVAAINKLKSENSNIWSKLAEVKWINEEAAKLPETQLTDEYRNIVKEELKDIYK